MRKRRIRRYDGSNALTGLALIICMASVLRLFVSLGAGAALDEALISLASDGRFVKGALQAEIGVIPDMYQKLLAASSSQLAGAMSDSAASAKAAQEEALPSVIPVQQADEKVAEITPEPVTEPAAEPVAEPAAEPVAEPAAEPVSESVIEPEKTPLVFDQNDADSIKYTNQTSYTPDTFALLSEPLAMDFSSQGPVVLIVHTHTCEAYTPEFEGQYDFSDSYRTTDQSCNIVAVGDELERVLTEKGISVLHDRSVNDYPSYTGSYTRTLEIIENYLENYPSIQIVIDLHRDSGLTESGEATATYYETGDGSTSQLMLVVGTDEGGLPHSDFRENLKFALALQALANRQYAGLMRPINLRQERFNQHATYGSLIVEDGFAGNTLSQSIAAIKLFGACLAELISSNNLHT